VSLEATASAMVVPEERNEQEIPFQTLATKTPLWENQPIYQLAAPGSDLDSLMKMDNLQR